MAIPEEFDVASSPRPGEFARLLLAAGGGPPRQRARDQQADRIGEGLKRRVLDLLAALDPEPEDFEATLTRIVAAIGEPTGPTRGVCALIRQDWESIVHAPAAWAWLIAEAVAAAHPETSRRRHRGPEPAP